MITVKPLKYSVQVHFTELSQLDDWRVDLLWNTSENCQLAYMSFNSRPFLVNENVYRICNFILIVLVKEEIDKLNQKHSNSLSRQICSLFFFIVYTMANDLNLVLVFYSCFWNINYIPTFILIVFSRGV